MADPSVTGDPDGQGESKDGYGYAEVSEEPLHEDMVRGNRLAMVLKGHFLVVDRLNCQTKEPERPMGKISEKVGSGRSWIRTSEGISQQIYSLPRLATSVSARERERLAKKVGAVKSVPLRKISHPRAPSSDW